MQIGIMMHILYYKELLICPYYFYLWQATILESRSLYDVGK